MSFKQTDEFARAIPVSYEVSRGRRLEDEIDRDMSSLSFGSTSFASSSASSLPVARSAAVRAPDFGAHNRFGHDAGFDSVDETPRPPRRAATSFAHTDFSEGPGASPASTAGHHVSAATLGAGMFKYNNTSRFDRTGDEFDPDRSLGRLVGELTKNRVPAKPVSPFVAPRSPRSPSPAPSMLRDLSFQLVRGEPPISPPHSRTVSSGSTGSQQNQLKSGYDAASRGPPPLADTARHNRLQPPAPQIPVSVSSKQFASLKTPTLVPWVSTRTNTAPGDITGMTGLLATPAKGAQFDDLDKNGIPNPPGPNLDALSARLRALETENGVKSRRNDELLTEANRAREMAATSERKSREHEAGADRERELAAAARRRQHELEAELQRLKTEAAESARRLQSQLQRAHDEALSAKRTHRDLEAEVARMCEELAGAMSDDEQRSICLEKIPLEQLADTMRTRLKRAMTELKARRSQMKQAETHEARSDLVAILGDLCEKVGDLTKEMGELRSIAEQSLMESRRNREERSRVADLHDEEEIDRVRADVSRRSASPPPVETFPSQLRQGLHAAAATAPSLMPPSAAAPTRLVDTGDMPEPAASPSPPARTQPLRNVAILSPTHSDRSDTSARCRRREREGPESPFPSIRQEDEFEFFSPRRQQAKRAAAHDYDVANPDETARKIMVDLEDRNTLPPKAVLERVIRGLEDEFAHCKRCFGELADQYKVLDAMSMKTKQRVLGENLKETIDKMDRKASQIQDLVSLLKYEWPNVQNRPAASADDMWRDVRASLPEDTRNCLDAGGVFLR